MSDDDARLDAIRARYQGPSRFTAGVCPCGAEHGQAWLYCHDCYAERYTEARRDVFSLLTLLDAATAQLAASWCAVHEGEVTDRCVCCEAVRVREVEEELAATTAERDALREQLVLGDITVPEPERMVRGRRQHAVGEYRTCAHCGEPWPCITAFMFDLYDVTVARRRQAWDERDAARAREKEVRAEAEAIQRDGRCVPVDVDLVGFTHATIEPPPADVHQTSRDRLVRVVLTPNAPCVTVRLRGGREMTIKAWANRTGIGPACEHEARREREQAAEQRGYEAALAAVEEEDRQTKWRLSVYHLLKRVRARQAGEREEE